jgi:hypothetical protein
VKAERAVLFDKLTALEKELDGTAERFAVAVGCYHWQCICKGFALDQLSFIRVLVKAVYAVIAVLCFLFCNMTA